MCSPSAPVLTPAAPVAASRLPFIWRLLLTPTWMHVAARLAG